MTEKQIDQLRRLLSNTETTSLNPKDVEQATQLDELILSKARAHVELNVELHVELNEDVALATQDKVSPSSLLAFIPRINNTIGAVALSITLTVGVFLGLGTMLGAPELNSVAIEQQTLPAIDDKSMLSSNQNNLAGNNKKPSRPPHNTATLAELNGLDVYANLREQQLSLPDAEVLIANMDFDKADDRLLAKQLIDNAMVDIDSMLTKGQWAVAEQRYAYLKERCAVCADLPGSLGTLLTAHAEQGATKIIMPTDSG